MQRAICRTLDVCGGASKKFPSRHAGNFVICNLQDRNANSADVDKLYHGQFRTECDQIRAPSSLQQDSSELRCAFFLEVNRRRCALKQQVKLLRVLRWVRQVQENCGSFWRRIAQAIPQINRHFKHASRFGRRLRSDCEEKELLC